MSGRASARSSSSRVAPEEEVVLLDEGGRAVGTAPKAEVHHRETPLHLAFSCYVLDGEDRLLVTRRALDKRTWPGVWTNSCCGHPAPGEPLEAAVRRRVREELALELADVHLALPAFRYRAVMEDGTTEHEMCPVHVARAVTPEDLSPEPTEVVDWRWEPWARFRDEVLGGAREVSPWCRLQVAALPGDLAELPDVEAAAAALPPAARAR
jgi:isopentenyl-diphosphate delta-isomerase